MMYAPDGEKLDDMFNCLAVSTQYRCVTDRRTDRRTSFHGIVRSYAEHRAPETVAVWLSVTCC